MNKVARSRLEAIREHSDGHILAELDLENRGFGNLLGLQQSGSGRLQFAPWEIVLEILGDAQYLAQEITRDHSHLIPLIKARWAK